MFKHGTVVQHTDEKWIGVVIGDPLDGGETLDISMFRNERGELLFETFAPNFPTRFADPESVQLATGYEFEAALALGDTGKALELYRRTTTAIHAATIGLESLSPIEALTRLLELRNTVQSEAFVQWVRSFPKKVPRLRGRHVLILETMETAPIHGVMADGVTVGTEMETVVYYPFEQVMPIGEELQLPLPKVGSFASVKAEVDTHEDFKNYRGKIKQVVKTGWIRLYAHNGSDWFVPSELHFEEPRHV